SGVPPRDPRGCCGRRRRGGSTPSVRRCRVATTPPKSSTRRQAVIPARQFASPSTVPHRKHRLISRHSRRAPAPNWTHDGQFGWEAGPMRADRLVATLLFLQSKGRATVAEVAQELEVSARTARRDLEALALAGVPVYSQAGRGGG